MNKPVVAVACGLAMLFALAAHAQDRKRGADEYKLCAGCHGFRGEGNAQVKAPALGGQESWYLERQIQNFRRGVRGGELDDQHGRTMAQMSMGLASDQHVDDLVAYMGTLPQASPEATLGGDSAKGKTHYAACAACHGAAAEGNVNLNAPALARLDDWYQLTQLNKFRGGQRGAHPDDTYGRQMAPMANVLADENAIRDVLAYIQSMR
jgi:cytochrome c oxidase subunit 2